MTEPKHGWLDGWLDGWPGKGAEYMSYMYADNSTAEHEATVLHLGTCFCPDPFPTYPTNLGTLLASWESFVSSLGRWPVGQFVSRPILVDRDGEKERGRNRPGLVRPSTKPRLSLCLSVSVCQVRVRISLVHFLFRLRTQPPSLREPHGSTRVLFLTSPWPASTSTGTAATAGAHQLCI